MATEALELLTTICLSLAGRADERVRAGAASSPSDGPIADETNPYWLIQTGRRGDAIRRWESMLAADPANLHIWHELAVAYYWQARDGDTRSAGGVESWERAIDHWVGVLASHEYWRTWAEERAVPCDVPADDRSFLSEWFLTRFTHEGAKEEERVERVIEGVVSARRGVREDLGVYFQTQRRSEGDGQAYADLLMQLAHEWGVAARLERLRVADDVAHAATIRGLPESFARWLSGARWQSDSEIDAVLNTGYIVLGCRGSSRHALPSCGPRMLARLGLTGQAEAWVKSGRPARTGIAALDAVLDGVHPDAEQLRFYLDPITGRLVAMVDSGQYQRCQTEIKPRLAGGRDARTRDLEKVMCLACHNQAEVALQQHEYDQAVASFETAYRYCLTSLIDARPFACDMTRLCDKLGDAIGGSSLPVETAVALLERLTEVAPGPCVSRVHAVRVKLLRAAGVIS